MPCGVIFTVCGGVFWVWGSGLIINCVFYSIYFLLDQKVTKSQGKFKALQWSSYRTGLRNHVTTITAPSHIAAKFSIARALFLLRKNEMELIKRNFLLFGKLLHLKMEIKYHALKTRANEGDFKKILKLLLWIEKYYKQL
jgi:hypothetical protein